MVEGLDDINVDKPKITLINTLLNRAALNT